MISMVAQLVLVFVVVIVDRGGFVDMEYSDLKKQLFVVDLSASVCLHCDASFYKDVCNKFINSTDYEDAREILDYIMDEKQEKEWKGFPKYIETLEHGDLFEVFNCTIDGDGLKLKPFKEGDIIHPMFISILQNVGYLLNESSVIVDNKEYHVGIVEYTPIVNESYWYDKILETNISVFCDTMEWIDSDEELTASVAYSKQHTQTYLNDEQPCFNPRILVKENISVVNQKTIVAAIEIKKQNPSSRIAVLNFANPINPGGAVKAGYMGQEEELCRCSTLFKVLSDDNICGAYYSNNKAFLTNFGNNSLIYSERIIICKSDEEEPVRLERKNHTAVDVITMAAPYCGEPEINDEQLFSLHLSRALHMLSVASAKGANVLILGAFGCGAFKNNPYIVAKAYKEAISVFPHVFDQIVFAVYSKESSKSDNYKIFREILSENNRSDL